MTSAQREEYVADRKRHAKKLAEKRLRGDSDKPKQSTTKSANKSMLTLGYSSSSSSSTSSSSTSSSSSDPSDSSSDEGSKPPEVLSSLRRPESLAESSASNVTSPKAKKNRKEAQRIKGDKSGKVTKKMESWGLESAKRRRLGDWFGYTTEVEEPPRPSPKINCVVCKEKLKQFSCGTCLQPLCGRDCYIRHGATEHSKDGSGDEKAASDGQ